MEFPDLYRQAGVLSKQNATLCLEEFTRNQKWKENAKILDIGCGDGSTNKEVLQKFAPASCRQIVGCDVSEKMVDYAKAHYGNELADFLVWDVSCEPPLNFRGAFDHVFSFYVLHWVKQQKKSGVLSKTNAMLCLEEFTRKKKWRENARVLDIGCGDGSTNKEVLRKLAPASTQQFVGCDVSEKMIEYAKRNYGDDQTEFLLWDVGEAPPQKLKGMFDHAFSFYVLHWIKDQESVFSNIYDTLAEGGNCLLVFLQHDTIHETFRGLSRSPKWSEYMKEIDLFLSPYCDSQDAKKEVTNIMEKVGFSDVEVKVLEKTYTYANDDTFKSLVQAISPFKDLNSRWDEFLKDYFEVVAQPLKNDYKLIVAYGSK